ncbi:bromodomain adjacent to zinc finger domain protein 2B-like [Gossypium australe]|uniref:Bromodomain adjacent to zinc finger domain protein 2B-like n=1 Tax=Gossypium australe TaxID=47621 RepID=A0A5B6W548_9ROSI|nr:bromodomain adjacent to zinc finger domain protein 2B-like [Gossypium australe]
MTEKTHENFGVFFPPKLHHSYVVTITLPQPTIRIKIPRVFIKAVQSRRNQSVSENGSKSMKKHWKKVGSMFSKVFGKKKTVAKSYSKAESESFELHSNGDDGDGDDDDGEMEKLKNMFERVENESSIVDEIDPNVACNAGEKSGNTINGRKGIVRMKKTGSFDGLASFRSNTRRSFHGKLKTAWWMKKMGRKTEKIELCKKRILMGGKCRPLE